MTPARIAIRVRSTRPGGTPLPLSGSPAAPFVAWMDRDKWLVCEVDENELRVLRRKNELDVEVVEESPSFSIPEADNSPRSRRGRA